MKNIKTFNEFITESSLNESFWTNLTTYSSKSENFEEYFNVAGVPGSSVSFLKKLQTELDSSDNEITQEIVDMIKMKLPKRDLNIIESKKDKMSSDDIWEMYDELRNTSPKYAGLVAFYVWMHQNIGKTIQDRLSY